MGYKSTLEAVRKRDKNTCRLCGRKQQKTERQFDVHHLNSDDEGLDKAFKKTHDMEEMVTLCRKCHMNLPVVREKMSLGKKFEDNE